MGVLDTAELRDEFYRIYDPVLQSTNTYTVSQIDTITPQDIVANYGYRNNGDLTFENATVKWGFEKKINSNGVAYGDLDNDGDLDLVMNNLSDTASVYKNNSVGNYLNIKLVGSNQNKMAIGAKTMRNTARPVPRCSINRTPQTMKNTGRPQKDSPKTRCSASEE